VQEKIKAWIEQMGGPEGIKQKLIAFKNTIVNDVLPAVQRIIGILIDVAKFIWEHRQAILVAIAAWEAFKIAISIHEVIMGTTAAIKALSLAMGSSGLTSVITSLSAFALPALAAVIVLGTIAAIGLAIKAFFDLQETLKENKKWLEENSKRLDELQTKVGSLSTENANKNLQNAIDKSREADKTLKDLTERYDGLGGALNAVKDQYKEWGETALSWINKVWDKMKEVGNDEDSSWGWGKLKKLFSASGGIVPQYLSGGGFAYASNVFEPQGTDTIPAMLTPGEMVLTASQQSTLFDQLNRGSGRKIELYVTGENHFHNEADMDKLISKTMIALSREQERAEFGM
jgi:hypothetical protein